MKINIKGNVVTSAYFKVLKSGIGKIIINTKDKWVQPTCRLDDRSLQDSVMVGAGTKFEYKHKAYVEFVAETEEEGKVLGYLSYESHCKDQKVILLVPDELLKLN